MTMIRTKLNEEGRRTERTHTFGARDVAMSFLTALFVRFPKAGAGSLVIGNDRNVITFIDPDVLE
jgi:hypothetical protein